VTRIDPQHPLLDEEDRAMQRFADECHRRGVGGSFSWQGKGGTVALERSAPGVLEVKVRAIESSEIRFTIDAFPAVLSIPREPLRAALAFKSLRAQAGGSPN
jgi:hypothetical protein